MDIQPFHPALLPGRPKQQVTLRLDADILDYYRTGGRRWQTRLNYDLSQIVAARRAAEAKPRRRGSK